MCSSRIRGLEIIDIFCQINQDFTSLISPSFLYAFAFAAFPLSALFIVFTRQLQDAKCNSIHMYMYCFQVVSLSYLVHVWFGYPLYTIHFRMMRVLFLQKQISRVDFLLPENLPNSVLGEVCYANLWVQILIIRSCHSFHSKTDELWKTGISLPPVPSTTHL